MGKKIMSSHARAALSPVPMPCPLRTILLLSPLAPSCPSSTLPMPPPPPRRRSASRAPERRRVSSVHASPTPSGPIQSHPATSAQERRGGTPTAQEDRAQAGRRMVLGRTSLRPAPPVIPFHLVARGSSQSAARAVSPKLHSINRSQSRLRSALRLGGEGRMGAAPRYSRSDG